jgi:hypothetical protein
LHRLAWLLLLSAFFFWLGAVSGKSSPPEMCQVYYS